MKKRKLKWWHVVLIVLALIIIVAAVNGNSGSKSDDAAKSTSSSAQDGTEKQEKKETKESTITISAEKLLKAYDDNEVKADNKYKDKQLKVSGEIDDIGKDITDDTYITVGYGDEYAASFVQCYFSDSDKSKVADLKKGDKITLVGTCDGLSINVLLKDCVIK